MDDAYHGGVIGELLIGGNGRRLDQELVTASGVGSRVSLHGLEQNWAIVKDWRYKLHRNTLTRDIEALTGLDAACIRSDTVSV